MKNKRLGKTQQIISPIGQGCMGVGKHLAKDLVANRSHIEALRLGIDLGMTFIDTAEEYGNGYSEEIVGKAIQGLRDDVFVATKFSQENSSYSGVLKSAEGSLRRLNIERIDLYQVHWPNPRVPIGETMRAMERLVKEGKVRYIGVSNFTLQELQKAELEISNNVIVSLQAEYNLFDRSIEDCLLPYCEQKSITVIAYSPLDQGRIAAGGEKTNLLIALCNKYGKTISQIVLNWLISHRCVVAIPKATNPKHVKENAAAADFELSEKDFEVINKIFSQNCMYVETARIRVVTDGQNNRKVYQTLEDAIENRLKFTPSPSELAQDISNGQLLKPVRLRKSTCRTGEYDYDLIEGRVRYWAWVIAFNGKRSIPAYIRDNVPI